MRFYYSGASTFLAAQQDPTISIGGFISSSLVPNDSFESLFSNISNFSIKRNITEYFLIALKNETGQAASNLSVYFDFPKDSSIEMQLSVVKPTLDTCDNTLSFEKIPNRESAPHFANFVSANGSAEAKALGNLDADAYLGFWFKKTINLDNLLADNPDACNIAALTKKEIIVGESETLSIILDWTGTENEVVII